MSCCIPKLRTGSFFPALLEVHDKWAITERRYLSEGSMARLDPSRDDDSTKEVERAKSVLLAS